MARKTPVKVGTIAWVKPVFGREAPKRLKVVKVTDNEVTTENGWVFSCNKEGVPGDRLYCSHDELWTFTGSPEAAKRRRLVADLEAALDTLKAHLPRHGHRLPNKDIEHLTGYLDGITEGFSNRKIKRDWK
jgi:hypothetical protein